VIKVLVVDDEVLLRSGLAGIVDTAPDMTVIGQGADGNDAVRLARSASPDVVLMDIRMPGLDGLEATRRIVASTPARVLVLTTFDLDGYVFTALRNGASGFLVKDTAPADLLTAIRVIASGEALLSPGVTRRLVERFARESASATDRSPVVLPDDVTPREREVLALVAAGHTNAEIAAQLCISIGTAKTHVARLLSKLDARDRVQLVILAHGLAPASSRAGDGRSDG
jgi:DNA-binding NarL/FixJ family response regulator